MSVRIAPWDSGPDPSLLVIIDVAPVRPTSATGSVRYAVGVARSFQLLCLTGPLAIAEPKTLRWRLWHTPTRMIRESRTDIIRLLDG